MQDDRLLIAESLSLRDTLVRELLNFKRKINISMGTWAGQELLHTLEYVRAPGVLVSDAPIFLGARNGYAR